MTTQLHYTMSPQLQALQQARQVFIDLPSATNWDNLQTALMTYNRWGNTPV